MQGEDHFQRGGSTKRHCVPHLCIHTIPLGEMSTRHLRLDGWRQSLPGHTLETLQDSICSNEEQPDFSTSLKDALFYTVSTHWVLPLQTLSLGKPGQETLLFPRNGGLQLPAQRSTRKKTLKTSPKSNRSTAPQCPATLRLQQFSKKAKGTVQTFPSQFSHFKRGQNEHTASIQRCRPCCSKAPRAV